MRRLYYFSGSVIPSQRANFIHVMKMCAALARQGFEVSLFGQKGQEGDPFLISDVEQNFDLILSPVRHPAVRILHAVFQVFRRGFPDVAYGRDPWTLFVMALFVPVVLELHEVPSGLQKHLVSMLIKNKNTKRIVCISNLLKIDIIYRFNIDNFDKVFVAHDGADLPVFDTIKPEIESGFCVGYAGSFLPGKGAAFVVELARALPDFQFHLCGGSLDEIASLKARYDGENIHYHGYLNQRDLQVWLGRFDVALAPYESKMRIRTGADIARWISPLKLFEYMAHGRCVLVSGLQPISEVISHDQNGVVLPPGDVLAWREAIVSLSQDVSRRARIGQAARRDIEALYSWECRAASIKRIIEIEVPL